MLKYAKHIVPFQKMVNPLKNALTAIGAVIPDDWTKQKPYIVVETSTKQVMQFGVTEYADFEAIEGEMFLDKSQFISYLLGGKSTDSLEAGVYIAQANNTSLIKLNVNLDTSSFTKGEEVEHYHAYTPNTLIICTPYGEVLPTPYRVAFIGETGYLVTYKDKGNGKVFFHHCNLFPTAVTSIFKGEDQ